MKVYTILWGHSGSFGKEWSSASEAARFAADVFDEVEAGSPTDAAMWAIREMAAHASRKQDISDYDWWEDRNGDLHVVYCKADEG